MPVRPENAYTSEKYHFADELLGFVLTCNKVMKEYKKVKPIYNAVNRIKSQHIRICEKDKPKDTYTEAMQLMTEMQGNYSYWLGIKLSQYLDKETLKSIQI